MVYSFNMWGCEFCDSNLIEFEECNCEKAIVNHKFQSEKRKESALKEQQDKEFCEKFGLIELYNMKYHISIYEILPVIKRLVEEGRLK